MREGDCQRVKSGEAEKKPERDLVKGGRKSQFRKWSRTVWPAEWRVLV